jgi:hypothetical protein
MSLLQNSRSTSDFMSLNPPSPVPTPKACPELVEGAVGPTAGGLADYFINPANLISVHLPTCQGGARFVPHKAPPSPPYDIYF